MELQQLVMSNNNIESLTDTRDTLGVDENVILNSDTIASITGIPITSNGNTVQITAEGIETLDGNAIAIATAINGNTITFTTAGDIPSIGDGAIAIDSTDDIESVANSEAITIECADGQTFTMAGGVEGCSNAITLTPSEGIQTFGEGAITLAEGVQAQDATAIAISEGEIPDTTSIAFSQAESLQIPDGGTIAIAASDASQLTGTTLAITTEGELPDGTIAYSVREVLNENNETTPNETQTQLSSEMQQDELRMVDGTLQVNGSLVGSIILDSNASDINQAPADNMALELLDQVPVESSEQSAAFQQSSSTNESMNTLSSTPTPPPQQEEQAGTSNSASTSENSNPNTVVIDISNPIHLCQNSLIVVNGQKCVLQQNPDTGQLFAYPVKEPDKPKKKRGRPRKIRLDQENSDLMEDDNSQPPMTLQELQDKENDGEFTEDELEKGLVEKPNEAGEIVKRSARKRRKARVLSDYETGALNLESGSDDEEEPDEDDEDSIPKKRGRGRGRPRKGSSHSSGSSGNPLMQLFQPAKRGRGRPRRYGVKVEPNQTQAFLIQMPDGQTVMMQVPMSNIPAGMSAQSLAQSIALQITTQLPKGPVPLAPKPPSSEASQSSSQPITNMMTVINNNNNNNTPEEASNNNNMIVPTETSENDFQQLSIPESNPVLTSEESSITMESIQPQPVVEALEQLQANEDPEEILPVTTPLEMNNTSATHTDTTADLTQQSLQEEGQSGVSGMPGTTVIPLPQNMLPIILKQDAPIKIGLKASENDLEKMRCPKCDFQAYYQQQYQEHLSLHPDDVQRCKCCSYLTLQEDELIMHYKENHPKCICTVCNHTAEHAYIIKRHMYRHSDTGCACEICGKTYKDHYILKMHMKMVHMPAEVLFECNICSKKFTRKAHLKRHLRTHDPDKPYKCPQCDYRGCEKSDITKHQLIHEEPKHTCEVCGKTFRHIKNKELHVKRHKGQRDYKCGVCDFYGYTFTDIRKHIERKHADAKTIICDKCGQAFKTEALMKEHQTSDQCELFMLDQALQDSEMDANIAQVGSVQEPGSITTITLSDGSVATLSSLAATGQIVLSDGKVHIPHSQVIDANGQLAILTNQDGGTQVAMVTEHGEISTESYTLVTDSDGSHLTMVARDASMLNDIIGEQEHRVLIESKEEEEEEDLTPDEEEEEEEEEEDPLEEDT